MTPFAFPSLLWIGLPLIAVPVVIHLINMLRQRRVEWAAMEFLLQSQRKNRTWVLLRQMLLLLLRMLAIAAVALMVAQPLSRGSFGAWFATNKTHHIVLLDDSYSMSDRWSDTSAFDKAVKVTQRLAEKAAQQNMQQLFTVLKYSSGEPVVLRETVSDEFPAVLGEKLRDLHCSELAPGPDSVLQSLGRLLGAEQDETRVVYLVSDFRTREWASPAAIRKQLAALHETGARIQLVDCVDSARPNLGVAELKVLSSVRSAGVAMVVQLAVTNWGSEAVRNVSAKVQEDGHERAAVLFEEIPPGETVERQFEVKFLSAGTHRLSAMLPADAVAVDNQRAIVVEASAGIPVLIIDGEPRAAAERGDTYFLMSALAPPGGTPTGIVPRLEQQRFLLEKPLAEFASIYLLNVDRLGAGEIDVLEKYVRAGGGLAFFCGPRTRPEFVNKSLYRQGQGLFPAPLVGPTQLLVDRSDKVPDMEVTNHPVFSVFASERNPFIHMVNIESYMAVNKDWQPANDSGVSVIAKLRNGAPLVIEKKFGEGRVVTMLTTAAPTWNNWGRNNPSYVVALLELQSYLAASRLKDNARAVGTPWEVKFDPAHYQRQVRFITPASGAAHNIVVDAEQKSGSNRAVLTDTRTSGVYEAQLARTDGGTESRFAAMHVLPIEGRLSVVDGPQLLQGLEGLDVQFQRADDLTFSGQDIAGTNMGQSLLYLLVGLLLGEQALAYLASYHRSGGGAR